MAKRKLFAGATVRRLREDAGWSQQVLAKRLKISASYLNQIEHNQRPLTASVLVELARAFRVDISTFSDSGIDRLMVDLRDALSDPSLSDVQVGLNELKAATQLAPTVSLAIIKLQAAHRALVDHYQSLDRALAGSGDSQFGAAIPFPYEEVRDFFHGIGNYVDRLDRQAEEASAELFELNSDIGEGIIGRLADKHGITVSIDRSVAVERPTRSFERAFRRLTINGTAERSTQVFALGHQLALLEAEIAIGEIVEDAGFKSDAANAVCSVALANYFAGALMLPYGRFHRAAKQYRHDLGILAHVFGASLEQVSHRLSTLQRPDLQGVPFYFLRVDRAGNITKRHSATRFQFARYGGACPLWNVHEAFETPDRMLIQIAEMPDGVRYLSLAQALTKPGLGHGSSRRRYAIGLGCELGDVDQVVYADDLNLKNEAQIARIGVSCRLCERRDCQQRAFPPAGRAISIDHDIRGALPYAIEEKGGAVR